MNLLDWPDNKHCNTISYHSKIIFSTSKLSTSLKKNAKTLEQRCCSATKAFSLAFHTLIALHITLQILLRHAVVFRACVYVCVCKKDRKRHREVFVSPEDLLISPVHASLSLQSVSLFFFFLFWKKQKTNKVAQKVTWHWQRPRCFKRTKTDRMPDDAAWFGLKCIKHYLFHHKLRKHRTEIIRRCWMETWN